MMSKKSWVTLAKLGGLSTLLTTATFVFSNPLLTNPSFGAGFGDDNRACAFDRPCFSRVYKTAAGGIFFKWDGQDNYSVYNVRWSRPGKNSPQIEVRGGSSGSFHLKNANAGVIYTFAVQGCNKRFLASSRCSPWSSIEFKN